MASFTTPLDLRFIDGIKWEVRAPFEYHLGALGSTERILIPIGFITDFASIPRALWSLLPPSGAYGKAAVVHDWMYQNRIVTVMWPDTDTAVRARLCNRGEADHALLEGMQVLGIGWLTRSIIYSGVRSGGWHSWNRYRTEEEK